MAILDKIELTKLYIEQKLTDKEIAERFNVDRTAIVHLRKKFLIQANNITYDLIDVVAEKLTSLGFEVKNENKDTKISNIDLLLNGKIRIEVMTANVAHDGFFRFPLTSKSENDNIESKFRVKLPNGRYKKLLDLTCDYIICYGNDGGSEHYWVIPSEEVSETLQTITTPIYSEKSKYNKYKDAWDLISLVKGSNPK